MSHTLSRKQAFLAIFGMYAAGNMGWADTAKNPNSPPPLYHAPRQSKRGDALSLVIYLGDESDGEGISDIEINYHDQQIKFSAKEIWGALGGGGQRA
jgi:hypothetical protein